jgi:hypothetical protein
MTRYGSFTLARFVGKNARNIAFTIDYVSISVAEPKVAKASTGVLLLHVITSVIALPSSM